jgi:hypothetical protein
MGIDCGFDSQPPSEPTEVNEEKYSFFINEDLTKCREVDSDVEFSIVHNEAQQCALIVFHVEKLPNIPYKYQYFFRVSSKMNGEVKELIRVMGQMAKKWF